MAHVLLIGSSGFLGSAIQAYFRAAGVTIVGAQRTPTGANQISLDLLRPVAVQLRPTLANEKFTHGILCAAQADVAACFNDPIGSSRVNVGATGEILDLFLEFGIKPIFFSSDLVFANSRDFYSEEDPLTHTTVYGKQKAQAEEMIRKKSPSYLIFRTSKLMSLKPHPRNILSQVVESLRKNEPVKSFHDQFITPAYVEDVAEVVKRSIQSNQSGTFHLASRERTTRLEIAERICRRMNKPRELIIPISMKDIPFGETRGCFYTLNSGKISHTLGFSFRSTEDGIAALT